jgi:hypothetical protein
MWLTLGRVSIGSLQLLSSGRIDFSQRHYPVDRSRHPRELGWCRPQASLPRSWRTPELRIPNAAVQTRIVSKARIGLGSRKSVRSFKEIICVDISEFESSHPSQRIRYWWRGCFCSFGGVDFVAILRLFLTRTRVQFAAETKCARCLGASDDGNLSVGISWLTFLLQSRAL